VLETYKGQACREFRSLDEQWYEKSKAKVIEAEIVYSPVRLRRAGWPNTHI